MIPRHITSLASPAIEQIVKWCLVGTVVVAISAMARPTHAQFLFVSGGVTRLTIQPPLLPGTDPRPDEDNNTRMLWLFSPNRTSKIVVSTVAPGQSFRLFVEAQDVVLGAGAPEVELRDGARPRDFIRNIAPRSIFGGARIYFRAEAPAILGNSRRHGNDNHTVYFTWTAQ